MRIWIAVLAAALLGSACGQDVHRPCGAYTPDWHGVKCFMQMHCVSCHSEPHSTPSLSITTVLPDAVLLDLATENKALVIPGDPNGSKLWRIISGKLSPTEDFWGIMPWGFDAPLPDAEIDHVRQWIERGAQIPGGAP